MIKDFILQCNYPPRPDSAANSEESVHIVTEGRQQNVVLVTEAKADIQMKNTSTETDNIPVTWKMKQDSEYRMTSAKPTTSSNRSRGSCQAEK